MRFQTMSSRRPSSQSPLLSRRRFENRFTLTSRRPSRSQTSWPSTCGWVAYLEVFLRKTAGSNNLSSEQNTLMLLYFWAGNPSVSAP